MFDLFKKNISETLSLDEASYSLFKETWDEHLFLNITSLREPFFYSSDYFEYLLSQFFVLKQLEGASSCSIKEYHPVLLVLLSYYIGGDFVINTYPIETLDKSKEFLKTLCEKNIISKVQLSRAVSLLVAVHSQKDEFYEGIVSSDIRITRDLLISANPVVTFDKGVLIKYYGDPYKTTLKYSKKMEGKIDINMCFDAIFKNSRLIQNNFIRNLYTDNLHFLMEVQSNKNIFRFKNE